MLFVLVQPFHFRTALATPEPPWRVKQNCFYPPVGVLHRGQVPTVVLLAWAAFPGVLIKQFVNCVQLKNAMSSLVLYDQQKGNPVHVSKQQ